MSIFKHETNGRPFELLIWQDKGTTRITHDRIDDRLYDILVLDKFPVTIRVVDNMLTIDRSEWIDLENVTNE
jgi:hypothetical protein